VSKHKPLVIVLAAICAVLASAVVILALQLMAGSAAAPYQAEPEALPTTTTEPEPNINDQPNVYGQPNDCDELGEQEALRYLLLYPLQRYKLLQGIERSVQNVRRAANWAGMHAHDPELHPNIARQERILQGSRSRVIEYFGRYRELINSDTRITPRDAEYKLETVDLLERRILHYYDVYVAAIFDAARDEDPAEVVRLMNDSGSLQTLILERLLALLRENEQYMYALYFDFAFAN